MTNSAALTNKSMELSPFVPDYDDVVQYESGFWGADFLKAYVFTNWREESMAWKESVALHGNLNPLTPLIFKGPDAMKFLSSVITNSFAKFDIGGGKHAILVNEYGHDMADGVLLRLGEDEFMCTALAPYINYLFDKVKDRYDCTLTPDPDVCMYQVTGPKSLAVVEKACGEDLSDIRFIHHRMAKINGKDVRVLRMGMAGTLAYEVYGRIEDARMIYDTLYQAGQEFGIKRMGIFTYMMNHTEGGFPQAYYHFPFAFAEVPEFVAWYKEHMPFFEFPEEYHGSMGADPSQRYRNPFELGWGGMVKFDHDFVGREALEKIAENHREMVTLEWNVDDIIDVYRSQFEEGEPYQNMDDPIHYQWKAPRKTNVFWADKVMVGDKIVGVSSGREYTYYYRKMISLCSIDPEYATPGTEVKIIWGDPGTRQKEIRAVVSRFPYLNEGRNQVVDVTKK